MAMNWDDDVHMIVAQVHLVSEHLAPELPLRVRTFFVEHSSNCVCGAGTNNLTSTAPADTSTTSTSTTASTSPPLLHSSRTVTQFELQLDAVLSGGTDTRPALRAHALAALLHMRRHAIDTVVFFDTEIQFQSTYNVKV